MVTIQYSAVVAIRYNGGSTFVPLGTNITFICTNFETSATELHSFQVIGLGQTPVLTLSIAIVNHLKERDIFTERRSTTLTVLATVANNLTVVQCNDGGTDPVSFSQAIQIIVPSNTMEL